MTIPTFPALVGITYPRKRTPWVDTTRMRAWSGRPFNQPKWAYPLYKYEIPVSLLRLGATTPQDFQQWVGFWNGVMTTPGQLFLYDDPDDDTATNQLLGDGDGVTTQFQALRTFGGFVEPVLSVDVEQGIIDKIYDYGFITNSVDVTYNYGFITDPVDLIFDYGFVTPPLLFVNGLPVGCTVLAGGIIQADVPPAGGATVSWTGKFHWLCNFDEDTVELSNFMYQLYEMKKITFVTARL